MTRTSRLPWTLSTAAVAPLALPAAASAASTSPPAGGADVGQVIGASLAASVLTVALLVLGFGHRSGRVRVLKWASDSAERVSGLVGLRVHRGDKMASVTIYMPVDRAIPVARVPASAHFDRAFVADHKIPSGSASRTLPAGSGRRRRRRPRVLHRAPRASRLGARAPVPRLGPAAATADELPEAGPEAGRRRSGVMAVLLACSTHIGTANAFAAPARALPLAVVVVTVCQRRRIRRSRGPMSGERLPV